MKAEEAEKETEEDSSGKVLDAAERERLREQQRREREAVS